MRLCFTVCSLLAMAAALPLLAGDPESMTVGERCMACHREISPGLYRQWDDSEHAKQGVTCLSCHAAEKDDPDAYQHHGATIATLVTPQDCGGCHPREAEEVASSYHAHAGQILESKDAYLAHVTAGEPAAILGCESCHGTEVAVDPDQPNKLSRKSWPNSGIGRINPDGSLGACNACHTRHAFSKAQARQPEACGKCHLGPDHPQMEVYEESKHGNTYATSTARMNLSSDSWVVGEDYAAAPTCATCHISATAEQRASHDVGLRLAWTLRPIVSTHKEDWQAKRARMRDVCSTCHLNEFVEGHFHQFDAVVRLYNDKFARPATEIMELIRANGLLENPAAFANDIEWTYWELWHHEGRRARHGAAMMGPDYTWWHGFYEVAQHFYFDFLPQARSFGDPEVDAAVSRLLQDDPMHRWVSQQTDDLKRRIRAGELQQLYARYFTAED